MIGFVPEDAPLPTARTGYVIPDSSYRDATSFQVNELELIGNWSAKGLVRSEKFPDQSCSGRPEPRYSRRKLAIDACSRAQSPVCGDGQSWIVGGRVLQQTVTTFCTTIQPFGRVQDSGSSICGKPLMCWKKVSARTLKAS